MSGSLKLKRYNPYAALTVYVGEDPVTYFLRKLRNLRLPPHQLRELGLPEDWFEQVSPSFVRRVLDAALRYEEDLRLLAKD